MGYNIHYDIAALAMGVVVVRHIGYCDRIYGTDGCTGAA